MRRRRAPRLADPDPDAREGELQRVVGEPGNRREARPDRKRNGNDRHPVPAVREPRERNAHDGVKDREGEPLQQAQHGVREPEVFLDRRRQDRDDLTVDKVERVNDRQNAQHEIAVARGGFGGGGGLRLGVGADVAHRRIPVHCWPVTC